eukprot:XP_001697457.1 predicted protein [Chlamydomonas reinhardtii]
MEPGRPNTLNSARPTPPSATTAALAIDAPAFAGSLTIRNTVFTYNTFIAGPLLPESDTGGGSESMRARPQGPNAAAVQEGPWADDIEAAVSVICKPSGTTNACSVQLESVTFEDNTGVATSSLYVLCDGGQASGACTVSLTDCTLRNNKLLLQPALDPENLSPPGFLGTIFDPEPGPGKKLLDAMVPWLTYTYPLLQYWKTVPDFRWFGLQDAANLPSVTGRTLGAVVVHSRNAPSPGLAPDRPPVLSVTVTGGEYSGNDGAALMSTATDWSRMAGGNGNWSDAAGSYFRHSADFTLSGLNISGHMSGVPAVWLRWPRAATVSGCLVTNSNGGIWMDEGDATPNTATVSNCWFDGNPSFVTGNLYVGGSDGLTNAKNALPGRTTFTLANTNFTRNYCRRFSGGRSADPDAQGSKCYTGERPFLSVEVHTVMVDTCRFEDNLNGGAFVDFSTLVTVANTAFTNNLQTYDFTMNSQKSDMSQGGGGAWISNIGTGGVSISSCNFTNNVAPGGGGAVGIRQVVFTAIKDSRFLNNTAPKADGGAIWVYVTERSDLQSDTTVGYDTMDNCVFDNNTAGGRGGAVAAIRLAQDAVWRVTNSVFAKNTANLDPQNVMSPENLQILQKPDQGGGGALYVESCKFLDVAACSFTDNRVLRHAGGAVRVVDGPATALQTPATLFNCSFLRNKAVMGGAVALSRMSTLTISNCTMEHNTVTDPWAWPDTSPVPGAANNTRYLPMSEIEAGNGGAIYAMATNYFMTNQGGTTVFSRNTAIMGGAIALAACPTVVVEARDTTAANLSLPANVYSQPGFHQAYKGVGEIPFTVLFQDNMASLGGGMYVRGTSTNLTFVASMAAFEWQIGEVNETLVAGGAIPVEIVPGWAVRYRTAESLRLEHEQPVVFYNNTANGGGALYLEDNQYVNINGTRFIANNARSPPLAPNFTGLGGRERFNGPMASRHCYNGGGGAMCVTGRAGSENLFEYVDLSYNKAETSGGGIYVAEGQMCSTAAGCYSLRLNNTNMTGNTAMRGQGGAVFWRVEGIAAVHACSSDVVETTSRNQTASGQPYNVTWLKPNRKPPAVWYGRLSREMQSDLLLQQWNGSVNATANGIFRSNGLSVTTTAAGVAFLNQLAANINVSSLQAADAASNTGGSSADSTGTDSGSASSEGLGGATEAPVPPVPTGSVTVNDTAWMGLPHTQLACGDWSYNDAVSGPDIGTTPYFLLVKPRVDFYSSNTPLQLPVTVHDWLGQNATGLVDHQGALVVVTAVSPLISGATTVIASNGTADFREFKLRGREGAHNITFTGRISSPERMLKPGVAQVYVRPCAINEFLSPGNRDECLACKEGFYNLDTEAEECRTCPENTDCAFPTMPAEGPPTGYLVPQDGYWHSSFYSDQAGRNIQLNTSGAAADVFAPTLVADTLSAGLDQGVAPAARRLLQAGQSYYASLLASTAQLLRDYMSSQCAPGYMGTLCGECAPDWGWVGEATCIECPSRSLNDLYYSLATLLTALSLAITVNAALRANRSPEALEPLPSSNSRISYKNGTYTHLTSDTAADQPSDTHAYTSLGGVPEAGLLTSAEAADGGPAPPQASPAEVALIIDDGDEPPHQTQHEDAGDAPVTAAAAAAKQQGRAPKPAEPPAMLPPNPFAMTSTPVSLDDRVQRAAGAAGAAGTPAVVAPPRLGRVPFSNSFPRAAAAAHMSEEGGVLVPRISIRDLPACSSLPRSTPRSGTLRSNTSGALGQGRNDLLEEVDPVKGVGQGGGDAGRELGGDPEGGGASNPPEEVVEKKLRTELPTIIRIFLAYLQVLAMLKAVPLDIPNVVDVYYGICSQATSYPGQLVSLDCSLPEDLSISPASARTILAVLAPLYSYVIAIIIFVFFDIGSFVWKKHFKRLAVTPATVFPYTAACLRAQLLVTFCTIMFFYYPSVVQSLMTIYNCISVDSAVSANPLAVSAGLSTDKVWSQDYGMMCYQGEHLALALGLGLPGLLIFGVGWPILSALIMTRFFACGGEGLAHSYRTTAEIRVADYKPRWIWWESAVMLRQLAIAAVVTFVGGPSSPTVQLLVVFCILTLAAVVQTLVQPYRSMRIGYLALASLYVLLATVYLMLYLPETSEEDGVQRVIISIIIVVINAATFAACIWYILRTHWHGMLVDSGLKELDSEARRNLTYAQARQLIKENIRKQQEASGSKEGRRTAQTFTKMHRSGVATATATAVIIGQAMSRNLRTAASTVSPRLSQRTASNKASSGRYSESATQSGHRAPETAAELLSSRESGKPPTADSAITPPTPDLRAAPQP